MPPPNRSSRFYSPESVAYNPFDDPETDIDAADISPRGNASVNGTSMEVVIHPPHGFNSRALTRTDTVLHRGAGALQAKNRVWEDIANKLLPPEESEFMIRYLEKSADERVRRTYVEGVALPEVNGSAPVPRIGLTFLPGADKPQVTRLEQINMAGEEPDQKDAIWRVNTAASLLMQFEVSADLSIVQSYKEQSMIVATKARSRLQRSSQQTPQRHASGSSGGGSPTARPALSNIHDAVTIDSHHVNIVRDLKVGDWDLESTLIEVDGSSLLNLIVNYRHLISRGGPDMTADETGALLDTMIEDTRRLCIRSPVLFRMSTRANIINSKNTRYGISHRSMFRTLTTSQGIKEIISLSASYYNSLDPSGRNEMTQKMIRPRFLQMIVVLLSLLNDDDLNEISEFLESTYKLRAERRHLEMLFLKVIPLMSINSKVFLQGLVPAVDGFALPETYDESFCWDVFMQRILQLGYLLPGTVRDLGREQGSWIVQWPEDGFKSTAVFNHLQYAGCRSRTINDIPPIEVHPESSLNELTVIMTNGATYTIGSSDLDRITCLTPGVYNVQEAKESGRNYDLLVEEFHINAHLSEAIRQTNTIVQKLNVLSTFIRKRISDRFLRRSAPEISFLYECKGSGRLTRSVAQLQQDTLAVTYKLEGRKITSKDSMRTMMQDIREMNQLLVHVERRIVEIGNEGGAHGADKRVLKKELDDIRMQISVAERTRVELSNTEPSSDEPISKVLYPGGVNPNNATVWSDYVAWYKKNDSILQIDAKRSVVMEIKWLSDVNIEIQLQGQLAKFFVSPLHIVEEHLRDDEVRVGDLAILVGQYMVIAEEGGEDGNDGHGQFFMTNYLRVVSMEEGRVSSRRRNRSAQLELRMTTAFR